MENKHRGPSLANTSFNFTYLSSLLRVTAVCVRWGLTESEFGSRGWNTAWIFQFKTSIRLGLVGVRIAGECVSASYKTQNRAGGRSQKTTKSWSCQHNAALPWNKENQMFSCGHGAEIQTHYRCFHQLEMDLAGLCNTAFRDQNWNHWDQWQNSCKCLILINNKAPSTE